MMADEATAITLKTLDTKITAIAVQGEKLMAAIDDVNAAITSLQATVQTGVTELQTLATEVQSLKGSTVTDAQLEDLATKINAAAKSLSDETTAVSGT